MNEAFLPLRDKLIEIGDLQSAINVLDWDQSTHMPPKGATARGRQLATLNRLVHELRVAPAMTKLLDELSAKAADLPPDAPEAAMHRLARLSHERARKLPAEFVGELSEHLSRSFTTWTQARPNNDFSAVQPFLEKTVEFSRRYSEYMGGGDHPADPLIDIHDRGMTAKIVSELFADLRRELVPLVEKIGARPSPEASFLALAYGKDDQLALGRAAIEKIGYDFERGRQDLTHHPFMVRFSAGDVRITTRVLDQGFGDSFFGTVHECGHALYELGIDESYDGTPLGEGVSAGVHESQSRLWENQVARSRAFWTWFLPTAQKRFPEQLRGVDVDTFYRACNRMERGLIRVDADEVTYNLHVMIRFDLELQLLDGSLKVADLPEAWNARYESDLGVRPDADRNGVLQDVHWYCEKVGGLFQGYTLGNLMAAQFFQAANAAHPDLEAQFAEGEFSTLRTWLKDHVHQHGSVFEPLDLVERATGSPLSAQPFLSYLKTKFGELYDLQ
ncbi:MAG: carboxypeptidase M32 [Myxococcota bacterium]